jgi:hypothetical protein
MEKRREETRINKKRHIIRNDEIFTSFPRVRESERERENYDRHHRRTKSATFEFDAFFFFFSERQQ